MIVVVMVSAGSSNPMTIVCVPGVSGCRSVTQPCATNWPWAPSRLPEEVVCREDDVHELRLDHGARHRYAVDGDGRFFLRVVHTRTFPELGFSGPEVKVVPGERAALP